MNFINRENTFYGIKDIEKKIEKIINDLKLECKCFEIKLIMIEAITNAFIHGNNGNENMPICLRYQLQDSVLTIQVTDCGDGFGNLTVPDKIDEDTILEDGGRGLYLINCYADVVELKGNSIIVKKCIVGGEEK